MEECARVCIRVPDADNKETLFSPTSENKHDNFCDHLLCSAHGTRAKNYPAQGERKQEKSTWSVFFSLTESNCDFANFTRRSSKRRFEPPDNFSQFILTRWQVT